VRQIKRRKPEVGHVDRPSPQRDGVDGNGTLSVGEMSSVGEDGVRGCRVGRRVVLGRDVTLQQGDHVDAVDEEVLHVTNESHVLSVVSRGDLQLINIERVAFARYICCTTTSSNTTNGISSFTA